MKIMFRCILHLHLYVPRKFVAGILWVNAVILHEPCHMVWLPCIGSSVLEALFTALG